MTQTYKACVTNHGAMEKLIRLLQGSHITLSDKVNQMAKSQISLGPSTLPQDNALTAQRLLLHNVRDLIEHSNDRLTLQILLWQATEIYMGRCIPILKRLKRDKAEQGHPEKVKNSPRIMSPLQRMLSKALRLHLVDDLGVEDQGLASWRKQCPPNPGFLDLPSEIRLNIYRRLWGKKRALIHRCQCPRSAEKPGFAFARGFPAALLQVNRRINSEAKLVFYQENLLSFAVDVGIPHGTILDVCVLIQAASALLPYRGHLIHHVRKVELYLSFNETLEKKESLHWETRRPLIPAIFTGSDSASKKTANDLSCLIEVFQLFQNWRTFTTCWEDCAFWQGYWCCDFDSPPDRIRVVSPSGDVEGIFSRHEWIEFSRKTRQRIIREVLRPLAGLDTYIVQDIEAKIGKYRLCDYPALHEEFEGCLEGVMRDANEAEAERCKFLPNNDVTLGKRVGRSADTVKRNPETEIGSPEHGALRRLIKRRRLRYPWMANRRSAG